MGEFYRCDTLDDAWFFLNQAKGLPNVPSARALQQRYIHACILFSWMALEDMTDYAIENRIKGKVLSTVRQKTLRTKLDLTLQAIGETPIEVGAYPKARKPRNQLTHPTQAGVRGLEYKLEDARCVFDFCSGLIARLFNGQVIWGTETPTSAKARQENVRLLATQG
jgi:hypothetical protein